MSLMNALVRRYINKWDQELSDITHHPREVQERQLELISKSSIVRKIHPQLKEQPIDSYLKQKELSRYEDYTQHIENLMSDKSITCKYYAQSSGTTSGTKKFIPTPNEFVKCNHLRGSWYQLHTLYRHDDKMSVFTQKNLLIGGSLYEHHKRYTIGDVSGIMISRIPSFFRPWYVPSISEAIHPDWHTKLDITATKAAKEEKIALLAGSPTWVLSTLREVLVRSQKNHLSELWPNLKAYIHGGVDFSPYRSQMDEITQGTQIRYIEVYNASEGFFAYQDRPDEEGMLLMLASGIFYEFIRESAYRDGKMDFITIDEVEIGVNYIMVITTLSGLVRYVQGDIVIFITQSPYRLKVVSRIESYINAFGEDLLLSQVQEALTTTNTIHKASLSQFHIAPYYLSLDTKGRHDWFIEWQTPPTNMKKYAEDLDRAVRIANPNYDQKRSGDIALDSLMIHNLPTGLSARYFLQFGNLSPQSKIQRIRNDRLIADRLIHLLAV